MDIFQYAYIWPNIRVRKGVTRVMFVLFQVFTWPYIPGLLLTFWSRKGYFLHALIKSCSLELSHFAGQKFHNANGNHEKPKYFVKSQLQLLILCSWEHIGTVGPNCLFWTCSKDSNCNCYTSSEKSNQIFCSSLSNPHWPRCSFIMINQRNKMNITTGKALITGADQLASCWCIYATCVFLI